jgi:hypothetical protein
VLAPDAPRGSSRALQTISHGTYPGLIFRDPRWRCMPYRDDPEQPRFGSDFAHFRTVLAQRVAERPWRYLSWYTVEKPLHLWGFDGLQASRDIYTYEVARSLYDENPVAGATLTVMRWLHWPLVALAGAAALLLLRRRERARAPALPLCLVACLAWGTVVGVVFAPWPRYVIPLRPELFMLAAYGAYRLARRRVKVADSSLAAILAPSLVPPAAVTPCPPPPAASPAAADPCSAPVRSGSRSRC